MSLLFVSVATGVGAAAAAKGFCAEKPANGDGVGALVPALVSGGWLNIFWGFDS